MHSQNQGYSGCVQIWILQENTSRMPVRSFMLVPLRLNVFLQVCSVKSGNPFKYLNWANFYSCLQGWDIKKTTDSII